MQRDGGLRCRALAAEPAGRRTPDSRRGAVPSSAAAECHGTDEDHERAPSTPEKTTSAVALPVEASAATPDAEAALQMHLSGAVAVAVRSELKRELEDLRASIRKAVEAAVQQAFAAEFAPDDDPQAVTELPQVLQDQLRLQDKQKPCACAV